MSQAHTNRPMHVVEILEATIGGTRTHVLQLVRALRARDIRMTLIASAERDPDFREAMARLESDGVNVIELPMKRRLAPLPDLRCLRRLRGLLRSLDADIVHTHASKAGALGRLAVRGGAQVLVHTPHTFYFQGRRGPVRWLFRLLERLLLGFTAKLIVLSEGQYALAQEELGADEELLALIPNGVDTKHFTKRDRRDACRRDLGIPADAIVVGAIARLAPQKACDIFLRAVAIVHYHEPDTHFILMGRGPLHGKLRKLARSLRLAGVLAWLEGMADPRPLYEAMDIFVLSSRYEGMPYTLLEAMAMELPVVATHIPGCREIVTEQTGLLVKAGQAEALAQAVLQLVRDPARTKELGMAARERAMQEFNLDAALDDTARLYRAMVKMRNF